MRDAFPYFHFAQSLLTGRRLGNASSTAEQSLAQWNSMARYLKALYLSLEELANLRVIHVSGTKGKGSTCAMVESILRHCGYRTGLFTSPALCDVRERIRINGEKIDQEIFISEVDWAHNQLKKVESEETPMPECFHFLTLVALRIFTQAALDVVILEVGIGGRLDATNIIPRPLVCGVASIGFDHMACLGYTLQEIAFEKAGIFKPGCLAFTVPQYKEALEVIEQHATDVGIPLVNVSQRGTYRNFYDIANDRITTVEYQLLNAMLAVHLTQAFEMEARKHPMRAALRQNKASYSRRMHCLTQRYALPDEYLAGLSSFERPGCAQVIRAIDLVSEKGCVSRRPPVSALGGSTSVLRGNSNLTFYLDGAHTPESITACINWFAAATAKSASMLLQHVNFLLFNCQQSKDAALLLKNLHQSVNSSRISLHHVFFTPARSDSLLPADALVDGFQWQKKQLMAWQSVVQQAKDSKVTPLKQISQSFLQGDWLATSSLKKGSSNACADIFPSITDALGWLRNFACDNAKLDVRVLVTGSLYLVGDVLKLLGRAPK